MCELIVLLFTVCLTMANPQYDGYKYEPPNNQQHSFSQQRQWQFIPDPLMQAQPFDFSQNFHTFSSHDQVFSSLPSVITPQSYEIHGTFQNDQSLMPQHQTTFNSFSASSQTLQQIDYSIGTNSFDHQFHTAITTPFININDSAQMQHQLSNENTEGTLDSFHIYSTFGPNPADIAPSSRLMPDATDSISLETPTYDTSLAQQLSQQQQTKKHVYVHVPPKEFDEPVPAAVPTVENKIKHYNIIFVKTPTASRPSIISKLQSEDKIIIYLLVKKPEELQQIRELAQSGVADSKPEVYFIKYKAHKQASDTVAQQAVTEHNGPVILDERSKQPSQTPRLSALQQQNGLPEDQSIDGESNSSKGSVDIL